MINSIFLENKTPEEIEQSGDFHEPQLQPTGEDGEFTVQGEKIPETVNNNDTLKEFTSIFYESDDKPAEKPAPTKPEKEEKEKPEKPLKESVLGFDII